MEFKLESVKEEVINDASSSVLNSGGENKNCTTTEMSISSSEDQPPKAEVKLAKLDNNENTLNVDTLIEMLSSTNNDETKLNEEFIDEQPGMRNNNNEINVPTTSTLSSPLSFSSSSLSKNIGPTATDVGNKTILLKKFTSPHYSNGGGKPMILPDLNKRMKQKRQSKSNTVVYQSQISDNSVGIKLCIKKSISTIMKTMPPLNNNNSHNNNNNSKSAKSSRKRVRKSNKPLSSSKGRTGSEDTDDDSYVKRRRKNFSNETFSETDLKDLHEEPMEQSVWGKSLPKEVLFEIFKMAIRDEGSIPTACRLTRVCSLWRQVALDKKLWRNIDLSTYFKEKNRTELRLKWFIENRMIGSEEINISFWKVTNTLCVLIKLYEFCPGLRSISLSGWRALSCDDLNYLAEKFEHLSKLDLSSINTEMNTSKTAVGLQSLVNAIEKINERLTHLNLADNRLSGIPQITQALTTYCPNLILLDLSNVKTIAVSHGMLHIEKLQEGCQKLKVLRLANSHVQLSAVSLQEQMRSLGFPELEELSVASLQDESRLMSDEALQRILKSSTKLKLLDVRGCARLTHDSLIRIPAWDLKHLFLSGSSVTRDSGSGLELISSKWAHSLIEFDLAWATMQGPLDNCLRALADKKDESRLNHLNLCGSAVSVEAVRDILENCKSLNSINLSSCRGLPRGIKREHIKSELNELLNNLRNEN